MHELAHTRAKQHQAVADPAMTVVARQRGKELVAFHAQAGDDIYMAYSGLLSPKEAFDRAHAANSMRTWVLRGVGWAVMAVGLSLIGGPLTVAPDVIPCVGWIASSIVSAGLCLVVTVSAPCPRRGPPCALVCVMCRVGCRGA